MSEPEMAGLHELAAFVTGRTREGRTIVAVAGAPGSGKSTLADRLASHLNETAPDSAAVLPMDGYHFDDAVLAAKELLPRKGSPETFDVAGLRHMLGRLRQNAEAEIAVPVFDRGLEVARAGARLIPRAVRTLIVEGNYLLLNRAPWPTLRDAFDLTVMIAVPDLVLRQRLSARWQGYGLSPEHIHAKLELNDLPNGRLVHADSAAADVVFTG